MEITKREIIFSIVIVSVMLLLGFWLSGKINDSLIEKYQKYDTAIHIDDNPNEFAYGMKTNVGYAFAYGWLKAVDTVTYDEIGGEYSYVRKTKEKYTAHTRVVAHTTYSNGKSHTYYTTETYWTWDTVKRWTKHSSTISFLDREFDYGTIEFPSSKYITTIRESANIRYVYYGTGIEYAGTLFANLSDDTIEDVSFYVEQEIDETIESLETGYELWLFWIAWILFIAIVVAVFYFAENRWLEDNH